MSIVAAVVARALPLALTGLVASTALLALAACGPAREAQQPAVTDGWHDFAGTWIAAGTRRTIALGGGRRASVIDLGGSMLLTGPARPNVGFRAAVIGLGDTATGFDGRAVWTDEKGDEIYSELHGGGTAAGNRIEGRFVGGTGRYAGATGQYAFTWQYVLEAEDGTVQGRAIGLAGRVRAGPVAPAAAEPKP